MGLEGRAEVLAGTFNAQNVTNTMWAAGVFSVIPAPGEEFRLGGKGARTHIAFA
jgi:hypothetical protein